jgi:hypothetical protein
MLQCLGHSYPIAQKSSRNEVHDEYTNLAEKVTCCVKEFSFFLNTNNEKISFLCKKRKLVVLVYQPQQPRPPLYGYCGGT